MFQARLLCGLAPLILLACGGSATALESPASVEPGASPSADAPPDSQPKVATFSCPKSEGFGQVEVTQEAYAVRYGASAVKFSDVPTELESPLETCGLAAVLDLLVNLECDTGPNPFGEDRKAAHSSRAGSMGQGGRCGSIIDMYQVDCEGQHLQVYIDMYVCGPGMEFL